MGIAIGRNDPCPCGSGKKYKKCCYQKDAQEASGQPKALKTHKFKVLGSDQADSAAAGALEEKASSDAQSLAKAVDRESMELLTDFSKADYRERASLPPPKREIDKEDENAYGGSRHDTE